jgi:hypothetical protein
MALSLKSGFCPLQLVAEIDHCPRRYKCSRIRASLPGQKGFKSSSLRADLLEHHLDVDAGSLMYPSKPPGSPRQFYKEAELRITRTGRSYL